MGHSNLSRAAAAIALGTVLSFSAVLPAMAQPRPVDAAWHGRAGWHAPQRHAWHGGHRYYGGYHRGNDAGAAIAGALLGLGLGAIIGSAIANSAPPPVYSPPAYYAPPSYYYGY